MVKLTPYIRNAEMCVHYDSRKKNNRNRNLATLVNDSSSSLCACAVTGNRTEKKFKTFKFITIISSLM